MRLLLISLLLFSLTNAYKILVYNSKYGHSHTNFMARIADILAEEGHNVTSLMPIIDPTVRDVTTKSTIIHVPRSEFTASMYEEFQQTMSDLFQTSNLDLSRNIRTGKFMGRLFAAQCRALLDKPELLKQLQEEQYDAMFAEHFDDCGVALAGLIKPKALLAVATGAVFGSVQQQDFGIPPALSYDPAMYKDRLDVHSWWDRLHNLYADAQWTLFFFHLRGRVDELFTEKYGKEYPSIREILSRSAYVFINSEPLIDFATPTISKAIYIPGIGAQEPKKLNAEWESLLNKRPRTVIISFGSMVKSVYLPDEVKIAIAQAVKAFPDVTFIWKYEEEDEFSKNVGGKIENLVLSKWMPQVDLLNHDKVRAFITHGGMGSTQETAMRGVPGIFVPIFAEQPRNAGMMEFNGLGRVIDKTHLDNVTKIVENVREVLDNPIYYENAQRIAAMLETKPFTSREKLIKYTEFAAEFGPSPALRPQSHDMNWIEFYNLDIFAVAYVIHLLLMVLAFKTAYKVTGGFSMARKRKHD